jgi:DNA-binding LacI/PurR family transcriptional regulator
MGELTSNDMTRIAAEAVVSDRTVRRYLAGEPVTDNTRTRIRQAMATLGLEDPNEARDES